MLRDPRQLPVRKPEAECSLAGSPASVPIAPGIPPRIARLAERRAQLSIALSLVSPPCRPECRSCKFPSRCGFKFGNRRGAAYRASCGLFVARPLPSGQLDLFSSRTEESNA